MARETKEERFVRSMTTQLTESLIELKNLASMPSKESDIEMWCQTVLKSVLGFSASAGYQIRAQETRGKMRFDLVVAKADKPDQILMVVEVKKLGADLNKSDLRSGKVQLKEYLATIGDVRWGVLTNGYEWRLYDFKSDAICISNTDIRTEDKTVDTTAKAVEETAWDLIDFSSHYFEQKIWEELSQEAQAFSPDSIARCVLSANVVKYIAKQLSGEHDYKVSGDVLTDKLAEVLERGLNDLVGNWNETQRAELDRYIRQQKKAAKKSRKRVNKDPQPTAEQSIQNTSTQMATAVVPPPREVPKDTQTGATSAPDDKNNKAA